MNALAAPRAVTEWNRTEPSLQRTSPVAGMAMSAVPERATPVRLEVSSIVLAALGLASPTTNDSPLDSPVALVLAAVGTRPRQIGKWAIEGTQSLSVSATPTSQTIDTAPTAPQQMFSAWATAAATNSAPVLGAQPVGAPDAVTGVVTGTVIASDPDGNTLTYAVTGQPASGTVTVNSATGVYTYTPTSAARLAAGTTPQVDTDTFTVSVSDGQSTTSSPVMVHVSPAQLSVISSTAVGGAPSGVAVSQDGTRTYVANTRSNSVSVIDTDPTSASYNMVVSTITVGSSPSALAVSGNRLYVANTGSKSVSVIDTTTNKVLDTNPNAVGVNPISVGSSPSALAVSGNRLYVANRGSNTVSVIDTTTNKVLDANPKAFGVNPISVGSSPSALAVSGNRLYVANTGSKSVSVIDTTTNKVLDTNPNAFGVNPISVGSSPSALAVSGNRLYVANTGSGTVSVIDTTTNRPIDINPGTPAIDAITVGSSPSSVTISPDASVAYVANGNDTVSVINIKTHAVVTSVAIDPAAPESVGGHVMGVGPNGTVYVSDAVDSQVRTLSLVTGAADATAPTVSLTGPAPNSTVSGTVVLSAVASDNVGVAGVQFQVDGVTVGATDTTAAYSTSWDTTTAANGTHTLTAVARDAAGNTTTSSVNVTVANKTTASTVTVIGSITLTGQRPGTLLVNADGTRAVLMTTAPIGPITASSYPDGIYGSTTRIAVIDTASGRQVGTTLSVTGEARVQLSADGTRALVTSTDSTGMHVAVLNTTTGTQVGETLSLSGSGSAQFIANNSRALIVTDAYSSSTNSIATRVVVLNTATGTQVGSTLTLAGINIYGSSSGLSISPDGTRLLVTTGSNVSVINTITGAQTGTSLSGSWHVEQWSADGSRALMSSRVTDAGGTTLRVAVVDLATGAQTGTTLTVPGDGSVQTNPQGTRALITTKVTSAGSTTTRLAVFNTTTGTQIGTTLALTGDGSVQMNADGSHALITIDVYDSTTASHSTQLTVFNTATGTQIGTTLNLTGGLLYGVQPEFSPDGTRVLITTDVYDSATTLRTSRVTTIDTGTGAQIGTTITLNGPEPARTTWLPNGRTLVTMTPTQYNSVSSPMLVATLDTTTGDQIGTTLSLTGMPTYGVQPVVTPDGKRVLVTTNDYSPATGTTVRITTVDTATGAQVGTTVTLTAAASGRTVLSPNANRAIVTAGDQVAVINTASGTQVGTTVALNGTPTAVMFSGDTRAVISTSNSVTVIDTNTGTQKGTTFTLTAARPIEVILTDDGTRALVTTEYRRPWEPAIPTTPVAVIDLTTGTQVGTTLNLIGDTYASQAFALDGTRAFIATSEDDLTKRVSTTRVTTINTATGMPTGSTVTLSGALASGVANPLRVVLSPDGSRALIAATPTRSYPGTSQVAVIDAASGTQIGDTVLISGRVSRLRWSADGSRVFVTTYITDLLGGDKNIRETVLKIL